MRLWSLHPKYLDAKGLVALWREGLLAQAVLRGETRGYRHHPQLERFKRSKNPEAAIAAYLLWVLREATSRGYQFDKTKIRSTKATKMRVSDGQLRYELDHLKAKLAKRSPARLSAVAGVELPEPHPMFMVRPGAIESWESVDAKPKAEAGASSSWRR